MLDELRRGAAEDTFDFDEAESEAEGAIVVEEDLEEKVDRLFLGMTAVERMFLSLFFFLVVVVIGILLLLVTGRIQF
ncbi:MAG TPA: hypothetical protein PLQ56_28555 [Aggregatilineales bacterium]|jgi:hypothetical protein|nr:hypothetical protein [Anaerolineae bacterium]HUN10583.1 hypothetical protein [Aggregatilineales bacterium]